MGKGVFYPQALAQAGVVLPQLERKIVFGKVIPEKPVCQARHFVLNLEGEVRSR